MNKIVLFLGFLCFANYSYSQDMPLEIPDDPNHIYEIQMKDRRLLEGKIELLDGGILNIKSSQFGYHNVSVLDIAAIKPLLRIDRERKPFFLGKMEVILVDSTTIVGKATQNRPHDFVITDNDGQRYIVEKSDLLDLRNISKFKPTNTDENPVYAYYMYTNTAYALSKGQVEFHNTNLFYNGLDIGVLDWLTVGIGADIGNNILDRDRLNNTQSFFWGSVKASYKASDNWQVGAGAYIMQPNSFWDLLPDSTNFAPYVINTFGNKSTNISFGIYFSNQKTFSNKPNYTFSGVAKLTNKISLISDNTIKFSSYQEENDSGILEPVSKYEPHLSAGIRLIEKRLTIDFAALYRNKGPYDTTSSFIPRELELGVILGIKYKLR